VNAPMVYVGMDGVRLDFPVPKHVCRHLVARAIKKVHSGSDPDLVVRGLTDPEIELVMQIIGTLQEHSVPVSV
jgi:hypothetical protein